MQQVCILRQRAVRQLRLVPAVQRVGFSQSRPQFQNQLEPFDASQLVLDLDASDSKYVRPYNETDERLERTAKFRHVPKQLKRVYGPQSVPGIYRATGADYLSLTLTNTSGGYFKCLSPTVRKILVAHKLPLMYGFKKTIEWLKASSAMSPQPHWVIRKYGHDHDESFFLQLADCKDLGDLWMITRFIATTPDGCKFLSDNGSVIVRAITSCRVHSSPSVELVLNFINATTQKIESQGLDPGEALCDAGMYYAAKASCAWAVNRYIESAVANNYSNVPSVHRRNAISALTKFPTKLWRSIPFQSVATTDSRPLRLLTGWETNGVPSHNEIRKPCFASLIKGNKEMYYRYITGIGRLGARESLWYEWMNPELTPIPESLEHVGAGNNRPHVFVIAFLLADDFTRASQITESIRHLGQKRIKARQYLLKHYDRPDDDKICSPQFLERLSAIAKLEGLAAPENSVSNVEKTLN